MRPSGACKAKDNEVNRANLYAELNQMNGLNAFYPVTTVGPVTYTPEDRAGVDALQLYRVDNGEWVAVGGPFRSEYMRKVE